MKVDDNCLYAKLFSGLTNMENAKIELMINNVLQLGKLMSLRQLEHGVDKITMFQFVTLQMLKQEPDAKVSNFCSSMKISKSSATQLIERLVKAGFVKRSPSEEDRRVIKLAITEAGEKELVNLRNKVINKMSKVLSKISEKDLDELIRIQSNLIEILKKEQYG